MKTFTLLLMSLFSIAQNTVENKPVSTGEELQFKLSYGWFTIGKGTFKVSDDYVDRNGKECLEITAVGGTAGFAGVFSRVDDKFGAIIDKDTFLPYYSFRDLSEGNSDFEEHVYYNYDSMSLRVQSSSNKDEEPREPKFFDLEENNVFDLMGGMMYARSIDYKSLDKGDIIKLDAFFDDKFYDFEMIYQGIEMIETKVGEINCFKVTPILPENSVFKGEDAITFWVSADINRLPLKVEANMNFGKAFCELTAYKNVKSGIDFE